MTKPDEKMTRLNCIRAFILYGVRILLVFTITVIVKTPTAISAPPDSEVVTIQVLKMHSEHILPLKERDV